MRLLVVEDDARVLRTLTRALVEAGYSVDQARDGHTAAWMARATEYDGVILDVGLPDTTGPELCAAWRGDGVLTPVLMLTARTAIADRVAGLDAGADDYLAKPFDLDELFARVRALVRRGPATQAPLLVAGPISMDPSRHEVTVDGEPVDLSAKEFAVLETLVRRQGQVVTRFDLLEHAWDGEAEHASNVINVFIKNLRAKIDRPHGTNLIETVRGVGYRLTSGES